MKKWTPELKTFYFHGDRRSWTGDREGEGEQVRDYYCRRCDAFVPDVHFSDVREHTSTNDLNSHVLYLKGQLKVKRLLVPQGCFRFDSAENIVMRYKPRQRR